MKNFALIGAVGYIAPRHLKAIKETGKTRSATSPLTDRPILLKLLMSRINNFQALPFIHDHH